MKTALKVSLDAWIRQGLVTFLVAHLFELFGKKLSTLDLASVVEETQRWMKGLRPDGVERWEMPQLDVHDNERLEVVTAALEMSQPVSASISNTICCDVLVVLGAMTESMEHRLTFALGEEIPYKRLCVVTAARALVEKEKQLLQAAGIDPVNMTETDAARFLLDKYKLEGDVVEAANKPDGKRATTEETITALVETLPPESWLVFASHMPFRFRQELTVRRALSAASSEHRVTVLGAPMLKPLEKMASVMFDEACRTLYEISKLPPEMLTEERPVHSCCNCRGISYECAQMQTCVCQETCDGQGNLSS